MPKRSLKKDIVDAGLKVMFRNGYIGASVRDIVAEASAPQGSFTNHFRSKEIFALEVLEYYFEHVKKLVASSLENTSLTPKERIRDYLDVITTRLANDEFARGCLIGDLSLEAVSYSEIIRGRLKEIFEEWGSYFAACIAESQAAGEIASTFEPNELADFLLASWEGAILRMKVDRDPAALELFKKIAFQTIFNEGK